MKRQLSLKVEWAWSRGELKSARDLELFVADIFRQLSSRYGYLSVNEQRGTMEIAKDVRRVLRALSYGGRRASDIPPQRLDYLRNELASL